MVVHSTPMRKIAQVSQTSSSAASSRESTWLRLRNLDELCRKNARILCLSLESLLDRCVPKAVFRQSVIALEEGRDYPPEELMNRLSAIPGVLKADVLAG